MKKSIEQDLIDASDALEHLIKEYPKLSIEDKVDVGARVRAISKSSEKLGELVKDEIKERLKMKEGTVLGAMFKAVLKLVPVPRLDQKRLKEEKPSVYAQFVHEDEDKRVTFEPR